MRKARCLILAFLLVISLLRTSYAEDTCTVDSLHILSALLVSTCELWHILNHIRLIEFPLLWYMSILSR